MALKTSIHEELPSVNLTPMIDVVFLLIVFFMVGTQFADHESHIDVNLPSVGATSSARLLPQKVTVEVQADGSILLDGKLVNTTQLTDQLRAARAQGRMVQVVVRADGLATHQQVSAVYAAVNSAGVSNMTIAVRSDPTRWR